MSQVYSTEPQTTGRVVLETTHGPIDINLWCKECPTTTRAFLQLCLDGYYDGMIFHRILSEFLIQTGLTRNDTLAGTPAAALDGYLRRSTGVPPPTSAAAGDPLSVERKKLELNPRIRFNHRGQVALALPLEQSAEADAEESAMLRYQFFVTLDEAPFLDAKHVAFGTVAGATMFNALRIGRTDADEQTGIPTDMTDAPPRIKSVKVDFHPFEDLVASADKDIPWKEATNSAGGVGKEGKQSAVEKRRKKRKGKRDLNVLSFGDEERDYEGIVRKSNKGGSMLSSHDVLSSESKFLSAKVDADVDKRSKETDEPTKVPAPDVEEDTSRKEQPISSEPEPASKHAYQSREERDARENEALAKAAEDETNGKEERNHKSSKPRKSKGVGAVEARRARYLKSGTGSSANKKERLKREGDTMAKLFAFKSKVIETKGSKKDGGGGAKSRKQPADDSLASRMAKKAKRDEDEEELRNREEEAFAAMPGYSGQVDDDGAADAGDWLGTKFKCKRHIDQDSRATALDKIDVDELGGDGRRMDDYVVLDEKRSGKGGRNGHKGHHHGSGKHSGRPHKSSGHRSRDAR